MNKSRGFHTIVCQFLALLALLFWQGFSFAKQSSVASLYVTNPSDAYWFLALLACLLAGYFMGSKRSSDEVQHHEIIEKKLGATDFRLKKQQEALAVLTQHQLKDWQTPADVFKEITEISAKTLDVERVGIWLFSHNKQQLECVDLYLRSKNLHTIATTLQAVELPEYFRFLSKHRVIAADDVMHHPATVEFTHGYAQENKISALLDGTIWLNNEIIGLICHEHINHVREWTLDEQNFVGSLADLTRLTIETDRRRKAETDLLKYQKDLEKIIEKRTAAIENSAKMFRFLFERAPTAILLMDAERKVLELNPAGERLSGYSREFAVGKTYDELFSSDETKAHNQVLVEKLAVGATLQGEDLLIKRADGSTIELSISRSIELDAEGNSIIISIAQDNSQRKALQANMQKLLDSEKRFSYVVRHAVTPIVILDKGGDILDMNPEAVSSAGYKREEMIGKKFFHLMVAKESRKRAILNAAAAYRGEGYRSVELLLQNAKGEKVEYECSLGIVSQDSNGDNDQMVAIAVNISRQKALQQSLIEAREAAESADRIKSMFVASMSHELRTPLNSIIGFLGVVLQGMSGELNLKQKDQLGRAYHSSKHLLSLITDVIDISKIEAGFLQVYVEKFELATLLTEVQYATQHLVQEKQLQLIIECPANITLDTDRKRLYQAVLNVVSNALKYTEQGSVKVVANTKGKYLVIAVHDTGIGIDEAGQANLFKPFERIESRLKIKTLGTGLGLYLTRKILTQLLGGEISVNSQVGVGSIFTIQVPVKMPKIVLQNYTSILEDSSP